MGYPMAARLAAAGGGVVVYNRTRTVAERFVAEHGGVQAESPAELAAGADVVISMVEGDAASSSVLLGDDGVLTSAGDGQTVLEMATVSPRHARRCRAAFAERGVAYLDAPVSGSVDSARSGQLSVMAGGSAPELGRVEPLLRHLAARITLVGGPGSGALSKLAVNLVLYALAEGVAEALSLVAAAGLDTETFYSLLERSAAGAPLLQYRRRVFLDPDSEPARFTLSLVARDLELALAEAGAAGASMPQAQLDLSIARVAAACGFAEDDLAALVRPAVRAAVAELGAPAGPGSAGQSGAQDEGIAHGPAR